MTPQCPLDDLFVTSSMRCQDPHAVCVHAKVILTTPQLQVFSVSVVKLARARCGWVVPFGSMYNYKVKREKAMCKVQLQFSTLTIHEI